MSLLRQTLDDLRKLSRPVRALLIGGFINLLGNGLILPYTLIYLHNVRHATFAQAGALLGLVGITGLLVTPLAGPLIDRIGALTIVITALVLLAVGYGSLAAPLPSPTLIVSMAVVGMGNGLFWPAQKAFLALSVPPDRLHVVFAFDQIGANLGIGLGALAGSIAIALAGEGAIAALFIANAITFAVFAVTMAVVAPAAREAAAAAGTDGAAPAAETAQQEEQTEEAGHAPRVTTLTILRTDVAFRRFILLQVVLVTCGYAAIEQLPVYLTNFSHVAAALTGIIFLANIVGNVLLPIPISRHLEGRDRINALRAGLVIWAALWFVVAIGTGFGSGLVVVLIAACCTGLFAIGEAIEAVTVDPLVSSLASEETTGRYMAGLTTSWNIGLIISPIIGGAIMQWQHVLLWPIFALILLAAAALTPAIRSRVPVEQRLVPKGG